MPRMAFPGPDRWYLQPMEAVEYHIGEIRRALLLGTDDPNPAGFHAAVPHAQHLAKLIQTAAIAQERRRQGGK